MRLFAVLAALTVAAAPAFANGRPPTTNGVFFQPSDPHAIFVRTTFGLLVSRDDGCSFRWVCERAIGYGGEFDPKYAIAADGAIFATTFDGLRVSRDGGCTWITATAELPPGTPGNLDGIWIDALDIAPTGEVWIATAESAHENDVFSSTDNGVTFQSRGLHSSTIWWKSVKVARSNPQRVFLAGYQVAGTLPDGSQSPPQAHLMRTDNGGATWTELDLFGARRDPPAIRFGATPIVLVAAVDPRNADQLLLISVGANGKGDRLYRSTDGGYSFVEVLALKDPIRDVVFASDAAGTVYVAAAGGGSWKSTDGGASFAPLEAAPELACLGQRGDGTLVGCGTNWQPDYKAVARSIDSASWGKTFRFVELAGPLACGAGTSSQQMCDPSWPALQQQFGATGPAASCPAAATSDAAVDPGPPARGGSGGCCDSGAGGPLGALALAGVLGLAARRRRRCCGHQS
jgi:MYXO-CTERM domain-containing protein